MPENGTLKLTLLKKHRAECWGVASVQGKKRFSTWVKQEVFFSYHKNSYWMVWHCVDMSCPGVCGFSIESLEFPEVIEQGKN